MSGRPEKATPRWHGANADDRLKRARSLARDFSDDHEDARPTVAPALMLQLVRRIGTGDETPSGTGSETQANKGGRPRKHKDAAAKQAAYRARNTGIVTWRLGSVVDTIAEIAAAVDLPANELAHQMLKYALMNRNWKQEPMFVRALPNAQHREKKNKEGDK